MESLVLPHYAQYPLHICLFRDVQNAPFLRQQLLDGNKDFEYAFLDATVLVSRAHILAACIRALNDLLNKRLRSRNVHSEIVFSLSPNNNIAESFRRFGVGEDTKHILAIKVGSPPEDVEAHLKANVEGDPISFTDEALASVQDEARICKIYKCELGTAEKPTTKQQQREAEAFIVGSIASKGS